MDFQVAYLRDLDDEFEELEAEFIDAPSWLMALQLAEARAAEKNKHLAELSRLK